MIYIYDNNLNKKCILPYNISFLHENNYTIKDVYPDFLDNWFYSIFDIKYPKLSNGQLIEKTEKELKLEGIIPLVNGEYISNGDIFYKEYPNDLLSYDWNGKEWVCVSTQLEKQAIYKNKMIETNDKIKELNEIGLGGGVDEIKLRAELEEYKTKYMNSVHEEALEADKVLSTPTTLEEE